MKKILLLIAILSFSLLSLAIPVMAEETAATEQGDMSGAFKEPEPYYSDSRFKEFYEKKIQYYGTEWQMGSMLELLQFILGGRCSYKQLHMVLENGYLTEYIDTFKTSGLIEQDYELPAGTQVHPSGIKIIEGGSEEHYNLTDVDGVTLTHEIPDFSFESEQNIAGLLQDRDYTDAYVSLPASLKDKTIAGSLISLSLYNGENLGIMFKNDDGSIKYAWNFWNVMYSGPEGGRVDLSLDFDEGSVGKDGYLKYDLPVLDKGATLNIPTDKDDTEDFNILDKDGNIVQTVTPDNGYITLRGLSGHGDFVVKRGKIRLEGEGEDNKNNAGPTWINPEKAPIWIAWILIVIMALIGTGFIIFGILKKK